MRFTLPVLCMHSCSFEVLRFGGAIPRPRGGGGASRHWGGRLQAGGGGAGVKPVSGPIDDCYLAARDCCNGCYESAVVGGAGWPTEAEAVGTRSQLSCFYAQVHGAPSQALRIAPTRIEV